ncbi:DUF6012 family protein [uncultured Clostridium sp.]|uniref:DUF6012 family protein n=1 Tax=uncultured Clostridium sp. TaxID=59620 RepID=UPI002589D01E|nr:DUF6012 family protein [uncultured Clostridium sp.]
MIYSKLYLDIKDHKIEEKLLEIFPNFDINNDYVLFISSNLYFEFADKFECEIELVSKEKAVKKTDSIELENNEIEYSFHYEKDIRTRKLYPNKNYRTMCKKFGRKSCDLGVPIIFKSFESLSNIEEIILRWNIKGKDTYIGISHNITFSNNLKNKMYILESTDYFLDIKDNFIFEDKYILDYINKSNNFFIAYSTLGKLHIAYSKNELDNESFYQKYQSVLGSKFIPILAEGTDNLSIYLEHNTHIEPIK